MRRIAIMKQVTLERSEVLIRTARLQADAVFDACIVGERCDFSQLFYGLFHGVRTVFGRGEICRSHERSRTLSEQFCAGFFARLRVPIYNHRHSAFLSKGVGGGYANPVGATSDKHDLIEQLQVHARKSSNSYFRILS